MCVLQCNKYAMRDAKVTLSLSLSRRLQKKRKLINWLPRDQERV